MSFGRRTRAPLAPVRTAPLVPVIQVRDWTGESPNARLVRSASPAPARVTPSAIGPALAGVILGFAVVALYVFGTFPAPTSPATYALVLERAGNAYVLDSGLTASDCYTGLSAGMFCEVESN